MDFVNKAYAQVMETLRSMTPATQISSALLLVVIVVGLSFLFQYQVNSGEEFLLGGRSFSSDELTRAEAAFAAAGLGKSTIVDGNRIKIPRGKKADYLAALAKANALPASFGTAADEANASDNPFTSTKTSDMRRSAAKQKELSLIISHISGIQKATIQFDEEVKNPLTRQKHKTAMVAVWPTSGKLEVDHIKAIRNIVATAYAGLERANVSITDMTSGLTHGGGNDSNANPEESLYASHKQQFEDGWKQKILNQLSWMPNSIVNVNVELDPQLQSTSQKVTIDAKPVPISSNEKTKEMAMTQKQIGGRPGAEANGVGNVATSVTATATAPESTTNENQSETKSIAGHEQSTLVKAGLIPTKVTAAVQIPASHFAKVWRERNPQPAGGPPKTPEANDLAKIETELVGKVKAIVRNLLPSFPEGTNPYPYITVESYPDLPGPAAVATTFADNSLFWLGENWQTLAMVGVGLISLMMMRSMASSKSGSPVAKAETAESSHSAHKEVVEEEDDEPEVISILRRNFDANTPNLKDELKDLVKDDPDAAATILRNWIGDAA